MGEPSLGAVRRREKDVKVVLFFVTEDWFFVSHFLDRAMAARDAGYRVVVLTHVDRMGPVITGAGLTLMPLALVRKSRNPLREWLTLLSIYRVYRRERPDIVHHIAVKPIVYGTIAARWAGVRCIINAPVGLGYAYSGGGSRLVRTLITGLYRYVMRYPNVRVITENPDDASTLANLGIASAERITLIRGAGVDLRNFPFCPESPATPPVVLLAARMLWPKGVGEFVAAARIVRERGIAARFQLAGTGDPHNPRSIGTEQLSEWHESGVIEWLGQRSDMAQVLADAHIVCLPSFYGEGLPKVLLEAAATGRALIATDTRGCREIVVQGENGLRVPIQDPQALADAIVELIRQPEERQRMGRAGRRLVEKEFSTEHVQRATLAEYARCQAVVGEKRGLM